VATVEALAYADLDDNVSAAAKFGLLAGNNRSETVFVSEEHCEVLSINAAWSGSRSTENKNGIKVLDRCIEYATELMEVNETIERCLLLGRLYQRRAVMLTGRKEKISSFELSAFFFQYATSFEKSTSSSFALAYWLEVESVLTSIGRHKWGSAAKTKRGNYKLPTSVEDALAMLDEAIAIAEDTTQVNVDYWNLLAPLTIKLSRHMLQPRNFKVKMKDLLTDHKNLWLRVGSRAQKAGVVEHSYILSDIVRLSKRKGFAEMLKSLETFITALEKLPR
jgi:hypothetical protein